MDRMNGVRNNMYYSMVATKAFRGSLKYITLLFIFPFNPQHSQHRQSCLPDALGKTMGNVGASPPFGQLGCAGLHDAAHTPGTEDPPTWTFEFTTQGVAGPVSRPVRRRKIKTRRCKWTRLPAERVGHQLQGRPTAFCGGPAAAKCSQTSAPEGQELLAAFANLTTHARKVVSHQLTLSGSEAAVLFHPDLEVVRQRLEAEIQQYGVRCSFSLLPCTGQRARVSGLMLEVSWDSQTFTDCTC